MTKKVRKLSKQTRNAESPLADTDQPGSSRSSRSVRKNRFAGLRKHWLAAGVIMFLSVGGIAVGLRYVEEDTKGQGATSAQRTTPKLTKEYIYAGSRILAVEDVGSDTSDKSEAAAERLSGGSWRGQDEAGSQQVSKGRATSGDLVVP